LRPSSVRTSVAALFAALAFVRPAAAEDIDLFTNPSSSTATAPNILIILDNSSNWSRNDQGWPIGKQGESELKALYTILGDASVGTNVNLGLMMFTSGNPADGGYIRYAVRNMTGPNKTAFQQLIGTSACAAGVNAVTGTDNCILKNFDSPSEKINAASTRYSAALFEAFKYFGGYTEPAKANLNEAGSPVDRTHFGTERYAVLDPKADYGAFTNNTRTYYQGPINADGSNSCAKNYIIFIGNGYPSQDNEPTLLTGINGNATVPAPIGNKSNRAANWAKYLYTTDVNAVAGRQYIQTYTIDVFLNKTDVSNQTALLKGMAKYGGGRYFEAKSEQAIIDALREIIIEIQSVNSVFASASLPINATNRSQNENQVFIGMFRPDSDAKPKWYGNLKQFQIALFGNEAKLADKNSNEAVAATTGFIQACSTSFWTSFSSDTYWEFSASSAGSCSTVANSTYNDLPDGGVVEKGGAAEVLRRGNDPSATGPEFAVNRTMYTCGSQCGSMVPFNSTNVTAARTTAANATEHTAIIDFTLGKDVLNEDGNATATASTEPRPSIHGDIAHSRPLPVNFGGARGVVVYYGANDGTFRAVEGNTGKELWAFIAPEHHGQLKRLYANSPTITYPNIAAVPGAKSKDYFFDGSSGLYQNADNSKVWIFPTMRRGGRMLYGFDVTNTTPVLKWAIGCPNQANDTDCTAGTTGFGQTWSAANLAFVKGFSETEPVIIMGGGYDTCLDTDNATTTCTAASKGNKVYVINADTGAIVKTFDTERSVAADVTLIDRDFDGKVDHAYVADALGAVYRIDFIDPTTKNALASGAWTITKVAYTNSGSRKFLFGPAALAVGEKVYLALGSGDRERPLSTNYPYTTPVQNRFYSFIDSFTNVAFDLNGATMSNFTASTDCNTVLATGKDGWFMDLAAGQGEQTVTSAVIFGGTVFFSTNRPTPNSTPGSCGTNLGEARGYAVNLLNASGVIGTGQLCGGSRSGTFSGGGIPPSPVVGIVPVRQPDGSVKPTNVLIGGINLDTGTGSPIGAQEPKVPIKQIRSRVYWYPHGER